MFRGFQNKSSSFSDRLYPTTDLSKIGLIYTVEPILYVTGGLLLALDAGNPASYPGTGTAWTDLSGNISSHNSGVIFFNSDFSSDP